MERKEEGFVGAGARRSSTIANAVESGKNSPSADFPSIGRLSGLTGSKTVSSSGSDDDNLPTLEDKNHGTRQEKRAGHTRSNSSQDDDVNVDDFSSNSGRTKKKKPKLDRSKLRKGKWTVEEEEYTSRIIHYFNTGLLTLPEGATLRSYLSDKLHCDPMRVTKKYAGASCLGRRVYLFRDRIQPTIAEIQLAKQELDHLEQRFRMRIERGHASPQALPPTLPDPLFSGTGAPSVLGIPTVKAQQPHAAAMQQLLLNLLSAQSNTNTLTAGPQPASAPWVTAAPQPAPWAQPVTASQQAAPAPWVQPQAAPSQISSPSTSSASAPAPITDLLQQLLVNASKHFAQPLGEALQQPGQHALPQPQQQAPNVSPEVANWAVAQVAASLGPLISQLTASNIQQVQQQLQTEQQKAQLQAQIQEQQNRLLQQQLLQLQQQLQLAPVPSPVVVNSSANDSTLQQLGQSSQQRPTENSAFDKSQTVPAPARSSFHMSAHSQNGKKQQNVASLPMSTTQAKARTAKDKAGGSDLLGFLSTLRQSYENALREKQAASGNGGKGIQNMRRLAQVESIMESSRNSDSSSDDANPRHPLVTDSASSQRLESSAEDSEEWTSKKTDPSSSSDGGDSDKEVNDRKQRARKESSSKGPPRKRHKCMSRQTG